jgi:FkbM family methyltransferase
MSLRLIRHFFRQRPALLDRLKPLVRSLGYSWPLHRVLDRHLRGVNAWRAIQIGAHDGITHDPYRQYLIRSGWSSRVIEPNPQIFPLLDHNYRDYPHVMPMNLGCSYDVRELTLFGFDATGWPDEDAGRTLSTMTSFSRENMVKGLPDPKMHKHVREMLVPCRTIEEIADEAGWDRVNALFVDVEGYENQILLPCDLDRLRPDMVVFEHALLPDQGAAICQRLADYGLRSQKVESDTVCVRS